MDLKQCIKDLQDEAARINEAILALRRLAQRDRAIVDRAMGNHLPPRKPRPRHFSSETKRRMSRAQKARYRREREAAR